MNVPWSYLPQQFSKENIEQVFDRLREFVPTGQFTCGEPLKEFEGKFARLIGVKHAIGVNSGTDAIRLSLKALGIEQGDEVITASNTFIATVGAIVENGATPVFVDTTDNFCMDTSQIEAKITERTKAIVPVHFAGQMTDMYKIMRLAEKYNLLVVEDSCQCIGGHLDMRKAGSWGHTGAFSLHPQKNLNVWGDGGVIVTDSDAIAEKLRMMRSHGLSNREDVEFFGCNSRLDTTQAVVANWLIEQVDFITSTRIDNAKKLDLALSDIPQITLPERFVNRKLVYHLYIVFAERRDELVEYLISKGIDVKVHYRTPVYLKKAVVELCGHKKGDFPNTDRHAETMISLPAHEYVTDEQIHYIADRMREFYAL